MILYALALAIGCVALYYGGDLLVRGANDTGRALGLSPAVIGLLFVSFGTSAPELFVSAGAALQGYGDVAVGNALGSNIVNLCLVLGLGAVLGGLPIERGIRVVQLPLMLAITLLCVVFVADAHLGRLEGLALLVAAALGMWWAVRHDGRGRTAAGSVGMPETEDRAVGGSERTVAAREIGAAGGATAELALDDGLPGGVAGPAADGASRVDVGPDAADDTAGGASGSAGDGASGVDVGPDAADDKAGAEPTLPRALLRLLGGILVLALGAEGLIYGGVGLAAVLGVPDAVVALTVTSVGTGLPEITATVLAAVRREHALAVANVVGSNIMNLGVVLGISALLRPIDSGGIDATTFVALIGLSLVLWALAWRPGRVSRLLGAVLLVFYALYVVLLVL